jgi:hypothetical protein
MADPLLCSLTFGLVQHIDTFLFPIDPLFLLLRRPLAEVASDFHGKVQQAKAAAAAAEPAAAAAKEIVEQIKKLARETVEACSDDIEAEARARGDASPAGVKRVKQEWFNRAIIGACRMYDLRRSPVKATAGASAWLETVCSAFVARLNDIFAQYNQDELTARQEATNDAIAEAKMMHVADLKKELKSRDESDAGNKGVLRDRLINLIQAEGLVAATLRVWTGLKLAMAVEVGDPLDYMTILSYFCPGDLTSASSRVDLVANMATIAQAVAPLNTWRRRLSAYVS